MDASDGSPSYVYVNGRSQQRQQPPLQGFFSGRSFQQDEREPLLSQHSDIRTEYGLSRIPKPIRSIPASKSLSLLAVFSILLLYLGYTLNGVINSTYYEVVRRQWDIEERFHEKQRGAWMIEVQKHEALRVTMNNDAALWEERRAQRDLVWEAERASMEQQRKAMAKEREGWAKEREERGRRQKEEERKKHDDEDKKREGITWEGLQGGRCSRYETREYTAVLSHVPLGVDAMEVCRRKPIVVHGRSLLPSRCEDQGVCGRVTGHWEVDFNEPGCTTWWNRFDKKGCYASGLQLYHSELQNLQQEDHDNWQVMCSTTPREINGVHWDGPTSCKDFGRRGVWPWGIWHVPDGSCF
ncbi:hypothetical protein M413DRAFT_249252 [Hebeloma cylindrosporum]|uniref:Uncharacterized protein n=1 Tax=Hebeloma cylindrosporum TaxID=76867 RepID=A0A0C2YAD6_HEBCY|nr:hypothetical protein M413DRAFT_249252 [Hebeloma cylindrosporum h7]